MEVEEDDGGWELLHIALQHSASVYIYSKNNILEKQCGIHCCI